MDAHIVCARDAPARADYFQARRQIQVRHPNGSPVPRLVFFYAEPEYGDNHTDAYDSARQQQSNDGQDTFKHTALANIKKSLGFNLAARLLLRSAVAAWELLDAAACKLQKSG